MPHWLLKAGLQGAISLLPISRQINYLFQRNVSKGLELTEPFFEKKLQVCAQHLNNYPAAKQSTSDIPKNALEIGTGWLPIVPIDLFLCGVDEVITVDVNPLLRVNLIQDTINLFIKYAEAQHLPHLPL